MPTHAILVALSSHDRLGDTGRTTGFYLATVPLYAMLMRFSATRLRPMYDSLEEAFGKYQSAQIDAIRGIETVKAVAAESSFRQLMLGQFHPLPPAEPGLWNADFRPLRSPVPLLAIRHMVPTDLPFLTSDRRFVESYREVFGDSLPPRQRVELARVIGAEA